MVLNELKELHELYKQLFNRDCKKQSDNSMLVILVVDDGFNSLIFYHFDLCISHRVS